MWSALFVTLCCVIHFHEAYHWDTTGYVPYIIEEDTFTSSQLEVLNETISRWAETSKIQLVSKTSKDLRWIRLFGIEGCRNVERDELCDEWAASSECKNNPIYMEIQCKKSCKICKDRLELMTSTEYPTSTESTTSTESSTSTESTTSTKYSTSTESMTSTESSTSVKSSPSYNVPLTPLYTQSCVNKREDYQCTLYAFIGECIRNKLFMKKECAKACNLCSEKSEQESRIHLTTYICKDNSKTETCFILNIQEESVADENLVLYNHNECRDQNRRCIRWHNEGRCEDRNVRIKCPRSCHRCDFLKTNKCEDKDKSCCLWLKQGRCSEPNIVSKCPKSCKKCNKNCKDTDENCNLWYKQGRCRENSISSKCPKSCNKCDFLVSENNSTLYHHCRNHDRNCDLWYRQGRCRERNIVSKCPKSCNRCDFVRDENNSTLYHNCRNQDRNCNLWYRQGRCRERKIASKCPKSCRRCDVKYNSYCRNDISSKECRKQKETGNCSRNRIARVCRKTCKIC